MVRPGAHVFLSCESQRIQLDITRLTRPTNNETLLVRTISRLGDDMEVDVVDDLESVSSGPFPPLQAKD